MTNIRRLQQAAHKRILAADHVNEDNVKQYGKKAEKLLKKIWKIGKVVYNGKFEHSLDSWNTHIELLVDASEFFMEFVGLLQIRDDGKATLILDAFIGNDGTVDGAFLVEFDLNKNTVKVTNP